MPKPWQSGFKRFFYNQNLKRDKSNQKYKKLFNHVVMLVKKLEKEGMTKRVAASLNKAQLKIKSYGINFEQMSAIVDHKGLSQGLKNLIQQHIVFVQKKWCNNPLSTKRDVIVKKLSLITLVDSEKKASSVKKAVATKDEASVKKAVTKKLVTKKSESTEKKPVVKKAASVKKTPTAKKPTTKKSEQ